MYQHFPIDDLLSQMNAFGAPGADMDLWICALSFKTLDKMPRPQSFVIDVVTRRPDVWQRLLTDCTRKVWLRRELRGLAIYMPNRDYACVRIYSYGGALHRPPGRDDDKGWELRESIDDVRRELDTPALRTRYAQWTAAQEAALSDSSSFVEGRQGNTSVEQSVVISGVGGGCVACGAAATRHATSTVGSEAGVKMLHLPLCELHYIESRRHPTVLEFAADLFSLDLDLPTMRRLDHVPDEMIEPLRNSVAAQLSATPLPAVNKRNGWQLRFELPSGWSFLLRMRTLLDYAYMLYDPTNEQRYRADSAPHHPEVPFFPDHEHAEPNAKNIVAPSFLYGNPAWDAKRLKQVAMELGAYELP